jgi:DNA repair exonuclease SbcCD ATPase subunit
VESAIGDLRGEHGEFANFFSGVFDQLESLMLELFGQHKWVESRIQCQAEQEAAGAEREQQFRAGLEEMRELEAKARAAHEGMTRIESEISGACQKFLQERAELQETREEVRLIGAEFRALREGVEQDRAELRQRQESIQDQFQGLASILADPAAVQSLLGRDEQLSQIREVIREVIGEQQVAWHQDRARLEAELDAERQRAAQQNEVIAEQRRQAAQQQAELDGQLKRMRTLIELLSNNMNPPFGADGNPASPSTEEGALASAFSQFQTLLRAHAQRRAGRQEESVLLGSERP